MVNMGCIDMNTWYSRIDKPERPDFVLFDLDPTPEVPWSQTIEVALILKELLDALELESFPKTSGGKGFHVLVLIDSNQNGEGKTIASVYSVRPKPGAPVSTPLTWDEVNDKLNPSIYSMDVVLERVKAK